MVKSSKIYNRFTLLSPELDGDTNQKLVLETDKPFNEDSMFMLNVGPEKGFENSQMIQLTHEEGRQLWVFLGRYYADMTRYHLLADGDGHNYLVSIDKKDAFEYWLETVYSEGLDEQPMPVGIILLGQSPAHITFTNPIV